MIPSGFSRFRPHFIAGTLCLGVGAVGYGVMKVALMIKRWAMAPPRLLHQEMEDFLRLKEKEAQMKALKEQ